MNTAILRLTLALTLPLAAASPKTWELDFYQDFLKGKATQVALSREGRLTLAPALTDLLPAGQAAVWAIATAPDGTVYAGTGNKGRLYRIDATGKSSLLWTANEPEIFAVAVDPQGRVYAATSPQGAIYRIENGKAQLYFDPKARYIWALRFGPDGALYAATGDEGRLYRITAAQQGELYFDSKQAHLTSLAWDANGRLLAGSDPNGLVYRIQGRQQAEVIYDGSFAEARGLAVAADGSLYMALLGSVAGKRAATSGTAATTSGLMTGPSISITVTGDPAQAAAPPKPEAPKPAATTSIVPTATTTATDSSTERSAIVRIHPDGSAETLWTSKEESAYDVALWNGRLYFCTDQSARVYELRPDRKTVLITQPGDGEMVRLHASPRGLLAGNAGLGTLRQLGPGGAASGSYESPVHDAGARTRWGRLRWTGNAGNTGNAANAAAAPKFWVRSGNTGTPDTTWTAWTETAAVVSSAAELKLPPARFIQWKAEFAGGSTNSGPAPEIDTVAISYQPYNQAPVVKTLNVAATFGSPTPGSTGSAASSTTFSVSVSDTGDTSATNATSAGRLIAGRTVVQQILVSWTAEDADNDNLIYELQVRGEGESQWQTLKKDITDATYTLDADLLPDGRYRFRLLASDRRSNPPTEARIGQLDSALVTVDFHAPVVTLTRLSATEVLVEAKDSASAITRCEYSLNLVDFQLVRADDGVADSETERFTVRLTDLQAAEQVLVVRVSDSGGNVGDWASDLAQVSVLVLGEGQLSYGGLQDNRLILNTR